MKVCVLASGSKGNVTYIASSTTKLLIDLGTTSLYVEKNLKDICVHPGDITGIIISHTHSDHVNGLKVFLKKYPATLFLSEKMYNELKNSITIENYQIIDNEFKVGDIDVDVIKTSHDADDSNAYIFSNKSSSVVYMTDTGYINQKNHNKLLNKSLYIFESNHDIKKLMDGPYPYYLKQRILSDKGHLSNKDSAYYLSKFIGKNTKTIILYHLSEQNNDPALAHDTLVDTLKQNNLKFDNIILSSQTKRTEVIEV